MKTLTSTGSVRLVLSMALLLLGSTGCAAGGLSSPALPPAPVVSAQLARAQLASAQVARSCPGRTVHTPSDLLRLRGCAVVEGDLTIEASNVEDLSALSALQVVEGDLTLAHNMRLKNLQGLSSLRRAEALSLLDNPRLTDISSLQHLVSLGTLHIEDSPQLRETRGLIGLRLLSELVIVNTGLSSLCALTNLHSVDKALIQNNPRLISVRGLSHLVEARTMTVVGNPLIYAAPYAFFPRLLRVDELTIADNHTISPAEVRTLRARLDRNKAPAVMSGWTRAD